MINLSALNTASPSEAFAYLEQCCVSKQWINKMIDARPFLNDADIRLKAAKIWFEGCGISDYKEAFTGHPKIGDIDSLAKKFAKTESWANNEQALVAQAKKQVLQDLAMANQTYIEKFGYIFIVNASGKSAEEMLMIIQQRLEHTADDEIYIACNEQHKITIIRLNKLIKDLNIDIDSQITTHVLDTAEGIPAAKVPIRLKELKNGHWKPISVGVTNDDGRIKDLLAPGKMLELQAYQMEFKTGLYFETNQQIGFYPEVNIQFEVKDHRHYHIPLLLSPYGYTTYRGS